MSITNPDTAPNPWGQQFESAVHGGVPSNTGVLATARSKPTHVPDDWDNDDEDEETDSQKIWETVNSKSPMPQLVISRSSTSTTVVPPPPPAIIQAPMRILKRPTPTTTTPPNTSSASPSPVPQTLAEREAKYQEARERIFGSPKLSDQDGPTTKTPFPKPTSNAIRNPTGPDADAPGHDSSVSQGFGGKRGRRPPKP